MAELEPNPEIKEQRTPTASEMLVVAREQSGLSQKEVADQLYMTVAFIRYIDEGAFDKIQKPAFIKGYLRSYARVVRANGDEVVSRYDSVLAVAEQSIKIRDVTEQTVGSANFTGPVLQTGLVGLFGVAVVVAMVWWIASNGEDEETAVSLVVASPPESNPTAHETGSSADFESVFQESVFPDNEIAGSDANDDEAIEDTTGEALPGITVAGDHRQATTEYTGDSAPAIALASSVNKVSVERNSDGGINYITLDAGGFDEIEITFLDECWLEIEDGDGVSIYADLNKSDDVLRVYGIAPFTMLLGRATAVTVLFNGEEVDLARFISNDETAKVRLGR